MLLVNIKYYRSFYHISSGRARGFGRDFRALAGIIGGFHGFLGVAGDFRHFLGILGKNKPSGIDFFAYVCYNEEMRARWRRVPRKLQKRRVQI